MKIASTLLVSLVALLHLGFLILEMFLWKSPIGLKVFRMTPEQADATAVLAANQGLYNGFLAAGLATGLMVSNPEFAFGFKMFFLTCVMTAGIYGAKSVSRSILWIQAFPAWIALILVLRSPPGLQ